MRMPLKIPPWLVRVFGLVGVWGRAGPGSSVLLGVLFQPGAWGSLPRRRAFRLSGLHSLVVSPYHFSCASGPASSFAACRCSAASKMSAQTGSQRPAEAALGAVLSSGFGMTSSLTHRGKACRRLGRYELLPCAARNADAAPVPHSGDLAALGHTVRPSRSHPQPLGDFADLHKLCQTDTSLSCFRFCASFCDSLGYYDSITTRLKREL